ncbi:uncharacterized protein ARMOST_10606 [Armillaria ostoyae]|uniref:Uncharacterized protein n=1 Tax=Armillaria ostoyae TaxID=47428 RepID=A0A284REU2_ARMOS|nr:uncharacterized protein ARMOST_10606 [Armillaria ostoyae]
MSSQQPNVEKISEILAQLHTPASMDQWKLPFHPSKALNGGDSDQEDMMNADDRSNFEQSSEFSSKGHHTQEDVVKNLDDEFFVPWQPEDDDVIVPKVVWQGNGNPDQGTSPDINAPDGLSIIPHKVIPLDFGGSLSTPVTSDTQGEAIPTSQSCSANQTTPSSDKHR